MEQNPLVSIGMPVYNDALFLREAIASLLQQTYCHFELIISDDASTDGSSAICLQFAAADNRIQYIRQPENLGISRNINFLLSQAKGEFFMVAGDDDRWDAAFLATMVKHLQANPAAVSAFCPMVFINERGEILAEPSPRSTDYAGENSYRRLKKLVREFDDGLGYALCRKNALNGLRFPVWWWINQKTAYDNFYPPVCYLLAKGDSLLVGDRPMWYNRFKTGALVNHQSPFPSQKMGRWAALLLRKTNLVVASLSQICAAGQVCTACRIAPSMIGQWLLRPVFKRTAGLLSSPPLQMTLVQLLVYAILFLSLPFINRVYSLESVGTWGFFQSSILMLWSFSQLRTDQLLITTGEEEARKRLMTSGFTAHVAVTIFAALILSFSGLYEAPILPLLVYWWGFGLLQLQSALATARNDYRQINQLRFGSAVLTYPGSCVAVYFWGEAGLLYSLLAGVWLPILPIILKAAPFFRPISIASLKKWPSTEKRHSAWMTANSLIVAITDHVFTLAIATYYDLATAAIFFMAQRILMAPVSLMVSTYGLYHYRKMYEYHAEGTLNTGYFFRFWSRWIAPIALFYGWFMWQGETTFSWAMGDNWAGTSLLVAAISFRAAFQALSAPLSPGFYILHLPQYPFVSGVFSLLITGIALFLMAQHALPLHQILWLHGLLMVFNILIYNILMLFSVSNTSTGTSR